MLALESFYRGYDFALRIFLKATKGINTSNHFSTSSKSDSDSTPYTQFVIKVNSNPRVFKNFRRSYIYRIVLEHVSFSLGKKYLDIVSSKTLGEFLIAQDLLNLSKIGKPRKYYYQGVGWISPTMLRYLCVNDDLTFLFGNQQVKRIAEIGVGFGGQFGVTSKFLDFDSYSIFDLPPVVTLTKKTLSSAGIDYSKVTFCSINPLEAIEFDLVVSNYAFSELSRKVQLEYLEKILGKAKRGYLIMNSGRTNISGRSKGKLTLDEILPFLTGAEIIEENPLTGPDNYIIVWGHTG